MTTIGAAWRKKFPKLAKALLDNYDASCVYFLLHDDEVVYVGSSADPHGRAKAHQKNKQFTHILFLPALGKERRSLEKHWIRSLAPKYNWQCNPTFVGGKQVRIPKDICDALTLINVAHLIARRRFNIQSYLGEILRGPVMEDLAKAKAFIKKQK